MSYKLIGMSYRIGAEKFYDLFGDKNDGPFYIELAHEQGGKALELGVGTARLAIQLARAGIEVWGIDNSTYMLNAAKENLKKESSEVRNRVHLKLADVKIFDLEERFDFVYFPSTSFDHIINRETQFTSLLNIKKHINKGGIYAFDIVNFPDLEAKSGWFIQERFLDEEKSIVRIGFYETDTQTRLMGVNLWYEVYHNGRMLERYFERGKVYIHSPEGIKELLKKTGYEIQRLYGGYNKEGFEADSELMILVVKPKI